MALITVPTPLKEGVPDLSFIEDAGAMLARHLHPGRPWSSIHHLPGNHRRAARPDPRIGIRVGGWRCLSRGLQP